MRSILFDHIQPLRGWAARLSNNLAFHARLLMFNPVGIIRSSMVVNTVSTKSPKDFNSTQFNLGYIEKCTIQTRKLVYRIWRSELPVKTSSIISPKDFNIINPECISGRKQRRAGNPEGLPTAGRG